MKLPLLSLLLICFGVLAFTRSSPRQISKYSYIMDALTRPYSETYNRIRNRTESGYNHIQSLLLSGFSGSDSSEESSSRRKKASPLVKDANLNIVNSDFDEQEADGSSRLLQALSCSRGSLASTQVNVYTCSGTEVSRTDYDALGGVGCTVATQTKSLCYCPYDYYGDTCQTLNTFSCQIERISHPLNCEGVDSYAYVYSFSGMPPCNRVQAGDTINFRTKAVCSFLNSQYNFEGVKHSKYEVITQPTAPTTFTYAISSDNVHLTTAPSAVFQTITFTNWKKMSDTSLRYSTSLTTNQMAGIDEISTSIPFNHALTQTATAGRYYFEMKITTGSATGTGTQVFATRGYNGGYFEQAGYQEPAPKGKTSKVLVIVLPILGGVLLIGLIVGYKIFQKRKERRERQEGVEAAPLIADE